MRQRLNKFVESQIVFIGENYEFPKYTETVTQSFGVNVDDCKTDLPLIHTVDFDAGQGILEVECRLVDYDHSNGFATYKFIEK